MRTGGALLAACLAVSGCGGVLSAVTGSVIPDVAANVQAGRVNSQTVGRTSNVEQRVVRPQTRTFEQSTGETGVRSERVEVVEIRNAAPAWIVVALVLGWLAPSPGEMGRWVRARWRTG